MNRPRLKSPETGKFINIYSKDIEKLLDKGYKLDDMLKLNIIGNDEHIPLTGNPDIDLLIMSEITMNEIKQYCGINQYTNQLCQRKDFWLNKINTEGLMFDFKVDTINWLKIYRALKLATDDIDIITNMDDNEILYEMNDNYNNDYFSNLLNKSHINILDDPMKIHLKNFIIWYNEKIGNYTIIVNNSMQQTIEVTHGQLYSFLFYIYYDDVIKDIQYR